ncbi:hypothetical protein LINGRAHAP2_LOCUS15852 [Linum grandiflorum]
MTTTRCRTTWHATTPAPSVPTSAAPRWSSASTLRSPKSGRLSADSIGHTRTSTSSRAAALSAATAAWAPSGKSTWCRAYRPGPAPSGSRYWTRSATSSASASWEGTTALVITARLRPSTRRRRRAEELWWWSLTWWTYRRGTRKRTRVTLSTRSYVVTCSHWPISLRIWPEKNNPRAAILFIYLFIYLSHSSVSLAHPLISTN